MLERSLLFAEVSLVAYLNPKECLLAGKKLGLSKGRYFSCGGAQAYWFQTDFDSIVVCRGTEPNEWDDIKADANALTALAETVGRVHRGFKAEVDALWPAIEKSLEENTKPLWFTGHSLGAAMATICTSRCLVSYIKSEPEELYTYGSPRIGCKRYVGYPKVQHFRWVNNNDIVTRVPPPWLGYRHGGTEMYLDRYGKIREIKGWRRVADRLKGFLGGILKGRIDQLSDHSMIAYIDSIFDAVRSENPIKITGK
ncbi:MAG: lipase family protein [Pirellulaceae bacterium]